MIDNSVTEVANESHTNGNGHAPFTAGEPAEATAMEAAAVTGGAVLVPTLPEASPPTVVAAAGSGGSEPPLNGHNSYGFSETQPDPNAPTGDQELGLFEHLAELRTRILRCVVYLFVASCVTWNFEPKIADWFAAPILRALKMYGSTEGTLMTKDPTEAFMIYFQISVISALILTTPLVLFEMWSFIEPALTRKERKYTSTMMPFSLLLFIAGCAMGYLVSPIFFKFFLQYQPAGVETFFQYGDSLILLAKMVLVFGVCFQVPVITIFLNKIGLVSRNVLVEYWRHVVVAIFLVVAVITPTWDPFTMTVCALPPCLLYMLSIWIVKWLP